jgi:hypothetical protein
MTPSLRLRAIAVVTRWYRFRIRQMEYTTRKIAAQWCHYDNPVELGHGVQFHWSADKGVARHIGPRTISQLRQRCVPAMDRPPICVTLFQ